jgi:ferritin
MLDERLSVLINEQIKKEFYSAYLYLDFYNYFKEQGLDGFANWYKVQAQEERDHALLFLAYMHNNAAKATLLSIDQPTAEYKSFMSPLKAGLEHERYVTASINNIYAAAQELKDFRTTKFLDWFVSEQGEEETNAETLIRKMELFGSDAKGLYMLDNELGQRGYAPPTLVLKYHLKKRGG